MTNNDLDTNTPEEFEKNPTGKPSLKEVWENNPVVKLVAIVLVGAVLLGGYLVFSPKETAAVKSVVHVDNTTIKQAPGQAGLDPAYKAALEAANKKDAEVALKTGISAQPTPIGPARGSLEMPEMPEKPKMDPLAEWRRATETHRVNAEKEAPEAPPPPEAVPMAQSIRPQVVVRQDPQAAQHLFEQMRTVVAAQVPLDSKVLNITKTVSPYEQQEKQLAAAGGKDGADGVAAPAGGASGADKNPALTIAPAGTIAYAQLINELNSDIKGPVLAQILSGPFAGGRAIGKIDVKDEYMVLTFTTVVKDAVSYRITGIAMDENTTLAGQATDVDHHYFTRIILPAAAKFIEGYGSDLAQTGTSVTQTSGGGQASSTPPPSPKQSMYKGLEESSKQVSDILAKGADRPITVKIAKGTTMGILLLETVTTKDAGK